MYLDAVVDAVLYCCQIGRLHARRLSNAPDAQVAASRAGFVGVAFYFSSSTSLAGKQGSFRAFGRDIVKKDVSVEDVTVEYQIISV
ncbi:uncharacterized protein ACHE_50411A [Aspergillus chevalieri]|uniref:Uncharacterized protein n=1 Tax=Aspergillus chevalieri TaxID=182096 RepID=A0A7R7VS85_ASPCH|nr:uncharacterized protein ACHE_50411A [Aspergillus chevalieri]BCR89213.1 hypothetical protein ACHE_50411A [Aspergillus chevalieri]